jgi:hypothetical protein
MPEDMKLTATAEAYAALLAGRLEHEPPSKILHGISPEDAMRVIEDLPYTIAGLVAHLSFWQQRRLRAARGEQLDYPDDFVLGTTDFPPVSAREWQALCAGFLQSLAELVELSRDTERMEAMPFEDRDGGFTLASHALHNTYHLGQIVLMRRLLGIWPPPEQ